MCDTWRSRRGFQAETNIHHFLYLVSSYDLFLFLVKKFEGCFGRFTSAYGRICSLMAFACQSKAITRLSQPHFSPC